MARPTAALIQKRELTCWCVIPRRWTVTVDRPSELTFSATTVTTVTMPTSPKCSGISSRARINVDRIRSPKSATLAAAR